MSMASKGLKPGQAQTARELRAVIGKPKFWTTHITRWRAAELVEESKSRRQRHPSTSTSIVSEPIHRHLDVNGWIAPLNGHKANGSWSFQEKRLHIIILELLTYSVN